ncbi:putative pentatricopeptide repeat-containing protein At3g13770, mitochondrial [Amborella trichopoda]|uniref:putative pentatricopeptide repeat-containing protein At3g13770, mitochondrial n=1 Tax=Amborella trichopoda TaxID=13333 RepID=UPI0009BFBB9F|nr:putative pentatricopeptide repeat-containing protein At3g13770, mitochondrial [Amborella trichopoda]|eukprot:XP_011625464.2 putative pentatricopeptide repeat-containing protein At3g13770, mitochondrial [Amborella trichopoda]
MVIHIRRGVLGILHNTRALRYTLNLTTTSFKPNFPPNSNSNTVNGNLDEALLEMSIGGFTVKFHFYDSVLTECVNNKALNHGKRVHTHMIKTCYRPSVYLGTRLLIFYTKCDCLGDARLLFERMPERNVVSWTAMISAYSRRGHSSEALSLFVKMLGADFQPNEFTFATVLTCCNGNFGFDHGKQIHSLLVKTHFKSHIFVSSSLLDMYAKAGKIHDARQVFDGMKDRDIVSCTAIIAGYAQLGLDEEALKLFRQLQKEGMRPNYVTFTTVLMALSGLAALEYGEQVHGQVIRTELGFYLVMHNSLIDMYSKCGSLEYARRVFDRMPEKSVISWNAMLVGYGKHGLGKEVVKLFEKMRQGEIMPDSVTYLAVLSGCSHGGMVSEGLDYFDSMVKSREIEPDIEHYGCVVDLLGRGGSPEKAFDFIQQMPFKPTSALWGSLLGACRVHSNVEIGEIAARKLFEIEPQNAGNYVILSNIYAASGRWEDMITVRKSMKENTVKKEPGKSFIKINRTLHTFYAWDKCHPNKDEIYEMLGKLYVKIKEVGYVPDLSCVLHDVDDEQKERLLMGHSEKLAITFGLIRTPHGMPIQIVKNLRICADCHNTMKYITKVYGREISLRDSNRFHRVVDGVCSCGDYW